MAHSHRQELSARVKAFAAAQGADLVGIALPETYADYGAEVAQRIEETGAKVRRRVAALRGAEPAPDLRGRTLLVVDDGLASGFTMRTAVEALRQAGASRIVVAVPTGSLHTVEELAPRTDALHCANVRGGRSFAVADAYQRWYDVDEAEAREILASHSSG